MLFDVLYYKILSRGDKMVKTINKNQVNIKLNENSNEIAALIEKHTKIINNSKKMIIAKKIIKYILILFGIILLLSLFIIAIPIYLAILIMLIVSSISILKLIIW